MKTTTLQRRTALLGAAAAALPLLAPRAWAQAAASAEAEPVQRLATAWRVGPAAAAGQPETGHHVGVLEVDWPAAEVRMQAAHPVPSRAHGVLAMPDGGFVAVAFRPGRWLLRCNAEGALLSQRSMDADQPAHRTFNGHVIASADGLWLFTTETDPTSGLGWVSVRDSRTLTRVAQFETGGHDPHDLLLGADGSLLVANGGIVRDALARKINPERIDPALVQLYPGSGRLLGRWQLDDRRLSLRHMAWSQGDAPLLGIGLQAEHDQAERRAEAPVLALWDGQALTLANRDARGAGYAGDISSGPGGGFVLSAQKAGLGLWWHPGAPHHLTVVARVTEPCALLPWRSERGVSGVSISAARGVARWHARLAPRMLPWPVPLAPDNHWVALNTLRAATASRCGPGRTVPGPARPWSA